MWFSLTVSAIVRAESLQSIPCASHSECSNMDDFCSRTACVGALACGICRPSAECYCDSDSIDNQCPYSPTLAVRFLQGTFQNQTALDVPDYECIRRLVVTGNMFIFSQFPVFTMHPASTAKLDRTEAVISNCSSFVKSGVFAGMAGISSEVVRMNATISSEGGLFSLRMTPAD